MPIDRQKQITVPGPAVRHVSGLAEQVNSLLGGGVQIAAGLAQAKQQKTDEQAAIERQGFDAELRGGFMQFDTEDGFDLQGFTKWTQETAAKKVGPMNQAMFRGSAQTLAMRRISELKSTDQARHERMDATIALGKTTAVASQLADRFRQRFMADREQGVETDLNGAALEYADSVGADTETGRATAYSQAMGIFANVQAGIFAQEKAEKQGLAVRGFTQQSTEMFLSGAPLDQIDATRRDAIQTLSKDFNFDRNQVAAMQQDWLQAMTASAVKAQNLDALDRVEAINKRIYDEGAGRKVRDGFEPATWAEMKRLAENDITSAMKGKLSNQFEVWLADARSMDQLNNVQERVRKSIDESDPRFTASVSDEDRTMFRMKMEDRQAKILAAQQEQILGPILAGANEPYSAAAIMAGADRVNSLAVQTPVARTLDGKTVPVVDPQALRLATDKLQYARSQWEEAHKAERMVSERLASGQSLAKFDPKGKEADALTSIAQSNIQNGSTLPQEIIKASRAGLVPDEMVAEFGRAMLPEGTGPQVMAEFNQHFSALASLRGMNSPVARQIEQKNPAVTYLIELEQLGVPRAEIERRAAEYGQEKIKAAMALVDDGIARAGGIMANRNTPYQRMLRAQAMDNVLRTMDPIDGVRIQKSQQALGKTQGVYNKDEIGGLVDSAINSATKQVQDHVRDVPVYGRTVTLPRNGWNNSGQPVSGMFDKIDGANLDSQIEALVRADGLNVSEPSMYRDGFHRRVVLAADSLKSVYNPETGRTSWLMRVDYVPVTVSGGMWGIGTTKTEEPAGARSLGWVSLMQERE